MTDKLEIKVEDANRDSTSTKHHLPKLKFELKSSVKDMLSSENNQEECFEPNKSSSTFEPKYERLGDTNEFSMEPLQNSTTIEESLFCSTTEDGKLNNLQELTTLGQTFLVCCIHLLLKSDSKLLCVNKVKTNSERTWTWIEKRGNFKVSKASVLRIIKEWIVDPKRNYDNKQNDAYFYDDVCKEQDSGYIYENECIEDKANSNTNLECVPGQEVSKKASDLSQHKISVKKKVKKRVVCDTCGASLSSQNYLNIHIQSVHERAKCFKCPKCDASFTQKPNLRRHISTIHENNRPFSCHNCETSFRGKMELQRHIDTVHEGKRDHKCSYCNNSFGQSSNLWTHIQSVHESKKAYKCSLCDTRFTQKQSMLNHIKSVHEKKKNFKCSLCDFATFAKSNLNQHIIAVHEGMNKVLCTICGETKDKSRIQEHIDVVHEGKKEFKCDICERTFGFRRTLIGHVAQVHSDEKPFKCEFSGCTWSFALKKGLQKHTAAVHEGKKHVNHPKKKIDTQGKLS